MKKTTTYYLSRIAPELKFSWYFWGFCKQPINSWPLLYIVCLYVLHVGPLAYKP